MSIEACKPLVRLTPGWLHRRSISRLALDAASHQQRDLLENQILVFFPGHHLPRFCANVASPPTPASVVAWTASTTRSSDSGKSSPTSAATTSCPSSRPCRWRRPTSGPCPTCSTGPVRCRASAARSWVRRTWRCRCCRRRRPRRHRRRRFRRRTSDPILVSSWRHEDSFPAKVFKGQFWIRAL